ncbi:MAG: hypothetical protein ABI866_04840 [Dokdonella sp.]
MNTTPRLASETRCDDRISNSNVRSNPLKFRPAILNAISTSLALLRLNTLNFRSALACILLASFYQSAAAVEPVSTARELFSDAQNICLRDSGRLWGQSLCGPILLVDYTDRSVWANERDGNATLVAEGAYFRGILGGDVIVANTPTQWSGTRWTQIVAPIPPQIANRHVLIAHELFHRIQPALGLTRPETSNQHLDTFEGRYLLQLEWRALAAALEATTRRETRSAIQDAVAFRHERYRLFPSAAADEHALEINEGVPEYTGVKLGLSTPQERTSFALHDLIAFVDAPTFVRSFAYATGPAYGLMLDEYAPGWRKNVGKKRFDEMLMSALKVESMAESTISLRAKKYDGESLRDSEMKRESLRREQLDRLKNQLVVGPVLLLPLLHSNYQFNPQTLIPLDGYGTVYPTMRLTDDWGALEVESGGALVDKETQKASVVAPSNKSSLTSGTGWRLTLKPGWFVEVGDRTGDYSVTCRQCNKP